MKKQYGLLAIGILIAIAVPCLFFYFNFKEGEISDQINDWSSFGSYLAGTVGTLFTILAVVLVYLTYMTQKEQQFENTFNQFLASYSGLINLIKEKWTMFDTPGVDYLTGREIFGCAANYLYHNNAELKDLDEKFRQMHYKHINVFGHWINFILELIDIITNKSNLSVKHSESYLKRFSSQMSYYELIYLGYYSLYNVKNQNSKLFDKIMGNFLFRIYADSSTDFQHNIVIEYIKTELKKSLIE